MSFAILNNNFHIITSTDGLNCFNSFPSTTNMPVTDLLRFGRFTTATIVTIGNGIGEYETASAPTTTTTITITTTTTTTTATAESVVESTSSATITESSIEINFYHIIFINYFYNIKK
jgi:hypothetical protein